MNTPSIAPLVILIVVLLIVVFVVNSLKTDRPKFLSTICILAAIFFLWSASLEIAGYDQSTERQGYNTFLIIASIASLVGVYGLWKMKKWGAYIFFLVHPIWMLSMYFMGRQENYSTPHVGMSELTASIGVVIIVLLFFDISVLVYFKRLNK